MDSLVLIPVAAALDRGLRDAALTDAREEHGPRLRFTFLLAERPRSLAVCLFPGHPWIARPSRAPSRRKRGAQGPLAARLLDRFAGARVEAVERFPGRRVEVRFTDGRRWIAGVVPGRPSFVAVDRSERIVASAEAGREGDLYRPPRLPPLDDPGDPAADPGRLLGVARETIRAVEAEAAARGVAFEEAMAGHLAELREGRAVPVIEGPGDLARAVDDGTVRERFVLLPWTPPTPQGPGAERWAGPDGAATAGRWYEAVDAADAAARRGAVLGAALRAAIKRARRARQQARRDRESFEDAERHRRAGEALLAGLTRARREGARVLVPDPWSGGQAELSLEVPPGRSLQAAADELFKRHRRAVRGRERADARLEELDADLDRLARLAVEYEEVTPRALDRFRAALEEAGIPVGLEQARGTADRVEPRLSGVRLVRGREGTIYVGKGARENDRLTFKVAGPDDFWFHASGVTGAHVVVRNPDKRARPSKAMLLEAAAVAAWYSEAKAETAADVRWTRRKYVRRVRGGPPGRVLVKRAETVRVRPGLPAAAG